MAFSVILQGLEQNDEQNDPPNPPHSQPPFLVVCARPHTVERQAFTLPYISGVPVFPLNDRLGAGIAPLCNAPIGSRLLYKNRYYIGSPAGFQYPWPIHILCSDVSRILHIVVSDKSIPQPFVAYNQNLSAQRSRQGKRKGGPRKARPRKLIGLCYGSTLTQPPFANTTSTYQTGTRSHQSHQNILNSPLSLETVNRP